VKLLISVRGHVSMMHICNANGVSLPPLYIFSGVKLIHNMLKGAPEGINNKIHTKPTCIVVVMLVDCVFCFVGSAMAFQKNGSFTCSTFCDVIRHLTMHSPSGKKLLILDGHNSHHDVDALDM
jgi:hypothetical protein